MLNNEYWQSPIGKIMGAGIHDTVGPLSRIPAYVDFIEKAIKSDSPDMTEVLKWLREIKPAVKRANKALDVMYARVKEHQTKVYNE